MKRLPLFFAIFMATFLMTACDNSKPLGKEKNLKDTMIRIAELEIDSLYLDEYNAILKEEAAASIRLESGVISIFPMYQKDNPTKVSIVEIYANKTAYESHLQTPHFLKYKTTTLNMVKSLNLIEMEAIDLAMMREIFTKLTE